MEWALFLQFRSQHGAMLREICNSRGTRHGLGLPVALPRRETYQSRIRRWMPQNFQILIVSAVKICKHCLQTASTSEGLHSPDTLPGWSPLETSIPRPWTITFPNENSRATTDLLPINCKFCLHISNVRECWTT